MELSLINKLFLHSNLSSELWNRKRANARLAKRCALELQTGTNPGVQNGNSLELRTGVRQAYETVLRTPLKGTDLGQQSHAFEHGCERTPSGKRA